MSNFLQPQFEEYHNKIKLHNIDDNQTLREKRDLLCEELKKYFKKKAEKDGTPEIKFTVKNQGSYSMNTGIKPLKKGDYDIDLMVLFDVSKDEYKPLDVKKWVYEALNTTFRTVEYKKPCVRVQYHQNGEPFYHVDLALYANNNSDGKTYLSVGKLNSKEENKKWEEANPELLREKINGHFADKDERRQMKRIIRYLKRWKDLKFTNTEYGKPTGIALTALTYELFHPEIQRNSFDSSVKPIDLIALKNLLKDIINRFGWLSGKISVQLPVEPFNDLFEKMSEKQHKDFKQKLEELLYTIEKCKAEPDPHEASKMLERKFGEDFPIVDKPDSGQRRNLAFPGKSESA